MSNIIFYYDHDAGEYTRAGFKTLEINFSQFIQLALLCQDLENLLDEGEVLTDDVKRYMGLT